MIRVGTDCSGIEAPIQALKNLGIPFSHEFSSDIDKFCIQSIKANYEPKVLFGDPEGAFPDGDITTRDIKDVPGIDLYVCGFPCQPFSAAGRKNGFAHESGNVFWSCFEVIKTKRPKYFILENVKGLLSNDKGKTWKTIWGALNELDDYTVEWKILNTKDYGIPQNRERLFIVGRKGSSTPFNWPPPEPLVRKLSEYVDTTITDRKQYSEAREAYMKKYEGHVFLDLGWVTTDKRRNQYSRLGKEIASCLCAVSTIVCLHDGLHRDATCGELLQLQGFPSSFKQVVSKTQMTKQIGNSMSVNVLEKIVKKFIFYF